MTNSIVNKSTDHAKPLSICQVEDSVNTIRQQLNGGEGKTMKVIEEIKKLNSMPSVLPLIVIVPGRFKKH